MEATKDKVNVRCGEDGEGQQKEGKKSGETD